MDATQTIYFLASTLLGMLPQLIVLCIGLVFSFMNWSKNPKVAKMAVVGLSIMLVMNLIGVGFTYIQVQLPLWYRDSIQMIAYINITVRFIFETFWTIGLGLLIYAVWIGREKA